MSLQTWQLFPPLLPFEIVVLAVQPGVASVQCAILQKAPGSVSFHLCQFNSLEGLEYEEVRRRFSGAVVCGIVRKNSFVPILNPAADEKMEKDDRIIALAPEGTSPVPVLHLNRRDCRSTMLSAGQVACF